MSYVAPAGLNGNDRREELMRKLIVNEFTSLDGVAQAPGAADEDPSGSPSCYIREALAVQDDFRLAPP